MAEQGWKAVVGKKDGVALEESQRWSGRKHCLPQYSYWDG